MEKKHVIALFDGVQKAADAMGKTRQTIWFWPDQLTIKQQDIVIGAAVRLGIDIEQWKHEINGHKRASKTCKRRS